ncbi:uncharacterized protein B0I36DRAFT_92409 [Microdochium trichocladiopsis]|uniref:Uncharacterized protein n=1 Tax=Microdochium trichocladiopsis TaxID=1682393 RepID=A0A9P8YCJ6_9PEZI|nr:uncharacterized protein B0I36DRAFT_92409 [Microdochium trichocladiopsis]KAH7035420.1 hypothetical protein B0I36DRAFT_92409 [Microdochium trichocladiopsis]
MAQRKVRHWLSSRPPKSRTVSTAKGGAMTWSSGIHTKFSTQGFGSLDLVIMCFDYLSSSSLNEKELPECAVIRKSMRVPRVDPCRLSNTHSKGTAFNRVHSDGLRAKGGVQSSAPATTRPMTSTSQKDTIWPRTIESRCSMAKLKRPRPWFANPDGRPSTGAGSKFHMSFSSSCSSSCPCSQYLSLSTLPQTSDYDYRSIGIAHTCDFLHCVENQKRQ